MAEEFINVDGTNYFVITENKSTEQIYHEIIGRMNVQKISAKKRREIIHEIKRQTKNA